MRRLGIIFSFALWLLSCSSTTLFANPTPLPASEAFIFSASFVKSNQVLVGWQIAPGYYLYTKRIHIHSADMPLQVNLPQGELKYDQENNRLEVFTGTVIVPVTLTSSPPTMQMTVDYQGCSEGGFCYPPMQEKLTLNLATQSIRAASTAFSSTMDKSQLFSLLTDQSGISALLSSEHIVTTLFIFALLGLLLAFTPCILPMVPILTGIIVGQKKVSTYHAFLLSLIYVLGAALTYALAGMVAAAIGSSLQIWLQKPWIIAAASGLFILLALSLFGLYELQIPHYWQHKMTRLSERQRSGSYLGVFLMGMISTLIISPCVTAPLVGVLIYIGHTGNLLLGAGALFCLGLGMGIPLLLIGTSAGKLLPKSGMWMEAIKKAFGILMLGMAVWLLSRILSPMLTLLLYGLVLMISSLYIALYLPRIIGRKKLNLALGFVLGVSGMWVLFGGINITNLFTPNTQQQIAERSFKVIHNIQQLNQQLALAKQASKPVILDFYADWCESCVSMDRQVFANPDLQHSLSGYILLRADLSNNTEEDQQLLQTFSVIAPPTVIFFDREGKEVNAARIVGEVDAKEFLARLTRV